MAINLVEYPNTSAPVENTDWTDMYALVAANGVPQAPRLTDWASVSAAPSLAQGAFILHEGSYYQVQAADETISGSPASGINYIVMSLSGSVLSASWTNSLTGYTYDPAYGAMYNTARDMLLTEVCYLDGSDYIRGYAGGADFSSYILADGRYNANILGSLAVDENLTVGGDCSLDGDLTISGGVYGFKNDGQYSIAATEDTWYELPSGAYQFDFFFTSGGIFYSTWLSGFIEWAVYDIRTSTWETVDKTAAPELNPENLFYVNGSTRRLRVRTTSGSGQFVFLRF